MSNAAQELGTRISSEIGKQMFGVEESVHAMTIALIGQGHLLLEGPPGVGKTRLSKAFANCLGGRFRRIQGTADLMPSDILGVHVYNSRSQEFQFKEGPIFADVLLVDEVNRAGPKTQSALLEAMEERQVSSDTATLPLPPDFLVVATQNPREFEGTFPLPESQLDRFMLSVSVSYPARDDEVRILESYSIPGHTPLEDSEPEPIEHGLLTRARDQIAEVRLAPELMRYVMDISLATRQSARISLGLSTRGALALATAARIEASLRGGDYAIPDDVQRVAPWVIPHRLLLTSDAVIDGVDSAQVSSEILESVSVPL
ncbi:MAG: MoxR family ATPase [Pseudomonadota bacterium]